MTRPRRGAHRALAAVTLTLALTASRSADAQMAVYDAAGYAQMLRSVAQGLQQLTALQQQIQQQVAMLAKLKEDATQPLTALNQAAGQILSQAQGIGYQSQSLASSFSAAYPSSMTGANASQVTAGLQDWQARSRQTLQEAMNAEAVIASAQATSSSAAKAAVGSSQGAAGQTSAIQATNQLLAVLSTQLAQLQTLMMTSARAAQSAEAAAASLPLAAAAESSRSLQYAPPASRIQTSGHL